MAQTGYTPIQLYRSATASAVPSSANLSAGELAINTADMALYAENSSGTVTRIINNPAGLKYPVADGTNGQILATNGAGEISFVTSVAGDVTQNGVQTLTNKTMSTGCVWSGSTIPVASGGTGATTLTGLIKGNGTSAFSAAVSGTDIKTVNSTSLLGSGNIAVGTVTSVAASVPSFLSVSGSPVTSSGTLAISYSGTALPVENGGTGATTLTGLVKGNGTGAFSAAVSGTDIKTIDGVSLLGSGNLISSNMPLSSVGGGYTLVAADKGKMIHVTSSGTVSIESAATLGDGWYVWIRNTTSSNITLDPVDTIDGQASGVLTTGMSALIYRTSSSTLAAMKVGVTVTELLTSGSSWVAPVGVRQVRVRLVGGGGGGGSGSGANYGCGGGGAGYSEKIIALNPNESCSYSVGAAGTGGSGGTAGTSGGSTSFTASMGSCSATGGSGGSTGTPQLSNGGSGSSGVLNISGQSGIAGGASNSFGGASVLGSPGINVGSATPSSAVGYGSGSCGVSSSGAAGNGTPGCIILEY